MSLPAGIADALAQACGSPVVQARATAGGDINDAFAVRLADGQRVFVKTRAGAEVGEYATEAAGLAWLGEAGSLAVPAVVAVVDTGSAGARFLALEWVDAGTLDRDGEQALGRGLAGLHAAGAARFGSSAPVAGAGRVRADDAGDAAPLRIGRLRLPNEPCADWPAFYAQRRLEPLVAMARRAGSLTAAGERAVYAVCERIDSLAGPPEPVARLHGDLWVGNVLAGPGGRPYLIDPAAYGGHREVDLAMLRLFGSGCTVDRVVAAYEEVSPLADGHSERVGLWQLLPLLVHAVLFGGGYGASVEAAARACLR